MRNRGSWMKGTLSVQHAGFGQENMAMGIAAAFLIYQGLPSSAFGMISGPRLGTWQMEKGCSQVWFPVLRDINALSWAIHIHGIYTSSDEGCKYTHLKANLCTLQISPTPSYATPDHLGRSLPLHSIEAVAEVTKARYNVADDIISTDVRRGGRQTYFFSSSP